MDMIKYKRLITEGWQNWPGEEKGGLIGPLLCSVEAVERSYTWPDPSPIVLIVGFFRVSSEKMQRLEVCEFL